MQICCNKCYNCTIEQLETLFFTRKLRLTAPRRELFKALETAHKPLDITTINTRLTTGDRTSTYRNLELFSSIGIIEIIHIGWKKQYELAAPFAPHHHHLLCAECGALTALNAPKIEKLVESLANHYSYDITYHHFELRGICPDCQSKNIKQSKSASE